MFYKLLFKNYKKTYECNTLARDVFTERIKIINRYLGNNGKTSKRTRNINNESEYNRIARNYEG